MKRSIFFLFIILIINFAKNEEEEFIDMIYDYIPKILVGMSETNSRDCSDVFKDNKEKILKLIKDYFKDIEDGKNLIVIRTKFLIEMGFIYNMDKCNPFDLLGLYFKINTEEGYKEIGNSVSQNNLSIYHLIREIKNVEGFDNKMASFGKILSLILNFYVS
jgi:hypothetical protein